MYWNNNIYKFAKVFKSNLKKAHFSVKQNRDIAAATDAFKLEVFPFKGIFNR